MPRTAIIVPCRLESTRLPRKLLHKIKGRALVLWVADRIAREAPEYPLYFAVDHDILKDMLSANGHRTVSTRPDHVSGTDRLAEANIQILADKVINVQADEPLVSGAQIRLLDRLIGESVEMATLATPFQSAADFANPNQVKVVRGENGRALYFSRAAIPYPRDARSPLDDAWVRASGCLRHLGLYAYTASLLQRFTRLPAGRLEKVEKLEQLRVLENGLDIAVGTTDEPTIGVDTLEDAVAFEHWLDRPGSAV